MLYAKSCQIEHAVSEKSPGLNLKASRTVWFSTGGVSGLTFISSSRSHDPNSFHENRNISPLSILSRKQIIKIIEWNCICLYIYIFMKKGSGETVHEAATQSNQFWVTTHQLRNAGLGENMSLNLPSLRCIFHC